ncbi:mechanosensitive ion channel family protein [Rugosibacter aromaticivorans]|uniref:mechanosensitive ion channel family protein n=1 Tax=Rugosibacter aromaticivorans TaxID=1565605 RepID=UPI000A528C27|nr:mechanosensitive ion channel domain-containing protein [Rugosibacter aromaticivorans]TBR15152.1 MAG: mechanosensitive ion channel [Rugosibacter sp.]
MAIELTAYWNDLISDLNHPDILWQLATLAISLLLAKLVEGVVRERVAARATPDLGRARQWGRGSLKRVIFPIAALVSVIFSRWLLRPVMHTHLLTLALPLLGSLAVIRLVFYILRHSFTHATWLTSFERIFATLAWSIVALHILGVLPDMIDALESITLPIGKTPLSLWQILQGLVTVAATLLIALWLSNAFESRLNRAAEMDTNLRIVLSRLLRALLALFAILIALPLVGIDLTTLSVFGGALGVGLGFGLQKIASNYVSGFIILLDNSIRIGNIISVGNDRGQVTRITTRFTVLRSLTGIESLVPNELLIGSIVQNESYSDRQVRVALPIQISYDSDLELAMRLLVEAAQAHPRVLPQPEPGVLLKEFADSGINLELGCWITDPENGLGMLRSDLNLAIWHSFKQQGITIPFPQREIRILGEKNG